MGIETNRSTWFRHYIVIIYELKLTITRNCEAKHKGKNVPISPGHHSINYNNQV